MARHLQLIVALLITVAAAGQNAGTKDEHALDIDKDIFRLMVTVPIPDEEAGRLLISWERELKKPFSLVVKAGPSMDLQGLGFSDNPVRYDFQLYASVELRFFFTLLHRIRKEKPVRNFSGLYISAEQYIESNPIVRINRGNHDGYPGSAGAFLQLGYQKQISQFYFNVFVGPRLYGNNFGTGTTSLNNYHGGISLGVVF
jgi:hypothetical protein